MQDSSNFKIYGPRWLLKRPPHTQSRDPRVHGREHLPVGGSSLVIRAEHGGGVVDVEQIQQPFYFTPGFAESNALRESQIEQLDGGIEESSVRFNRQRDRSLRQSRRVQGAAVRFALGHSHRGRK